MHRTLATLSLLGLTLAAASPQRPLRLPQDPCLAPDGRQVAFAWQGDLWKASLGEPKAQRLTTHLAEDSAPRFSRDGRWVAFLSRRSGADQVWVMPVEGGEPRQVTFDSAPKTLLGFSADDRDLLVVMGVDESPFRTEARRLVKLPVAGGQAPVRLLEASMDDAALSPDGTKVLFTRGRIEWTRKGYRGAAAYQLWLADLAGGKVTYRRLSEDKPRFQNVTERWPLWAPDGKGYYFTSDPKGTFEVFHRALDGSGLRQVTKVGREGGDDGVAFPSLSADGKTLLFRRGFDLWTADTARGEARRVALEVTGDTPVRALEPRQDTTATEIAFTPDGRQMAFVAGDDVWVMDTVLKEPVRLTATPHRETGLAFSPDGRRLTFTSEVSGEVDLYTVDCPREDGAWFLGKDFQVKALTQDRAVESNPTPDPTGRLLAVVKDRDLWILQADGSKPRKLVESWSGVDFDWSPDGRWIVYSAQDASFNHDIWVVPVDGSRAPLNLSRHPDNDTQPRWSPDGRRLAWVGQREGEESDIFVVDLTRAVAEETERDRNLKKAMEELAAARKPAPRPRPEGAPAEGGRPRSAEARPQGETAPAEARRPQVAIEAEGLHDRIRRIPFPGREMGLLWSPDGTQLAFAHLGVGMMPGEDDQAAPRRTPTPTPGAPAAPGTAAPRPTGPQLHTLTFPDKLTPAPVQGPMLTGAQWLKQGNQIVGLQAGVPASLAMGPTPKTTSHTFRVHTTRDWRAYREVVFHQAWRHMRDSFYDPAHNNKDWEKVRRTHAPVAGQCLGAREFETLVNMMLGELNASHLGFTRTPNPLPQPATLPEPRPMALGLRFTPGTLKVASVIPGSPCSLGRSEVKPGETLVAIDGRPVDARTDLSPLLALPQPRDLQLELASDKGEKRTVTVRPVASVDPLLYKEWVGRTRAEVERLSGGKLGYLHIQGMNMPSFRQFEEDLYAAGAGKEGLIIDVRFNGGGNTADHVLTALTQPAHAITVPRNGQPGYPHDRMVYATWQKPIVMMCNEYSFSNAEIVSHAIKTLGRGRLVGMRTAGGVISTGAATLQDGSNLRMPTRGWYLKDTGEDMEMNGAEPHIALWNAPEGPDAQLAAAVKALAEDVAKDKAKPRPKFVNAAELRK